MFFQLFSSSFVSMCKNYTEYTMQVYYFHIPLTLYLLSLWAHFKPLFILVELNCPGVQCDSVEKQITFSSSCEGATDVSSIFGYFVSKCTLDIHCIGSNGPKVTVAPLDFEIGLYLDHYPICVIYACGCLVVCIDMCMYC